MSVECHTHTHKKIIIKEVCGGYENELLRMLGITEQQTDESEMIKLAVAVLIFVILCVSSR